MPVVADLTTTDETFGVHCVGATKTAGHSARVIAHKRAGAEVGFNTAKAGTGIHASIPPGPVIEGAGAGDGAAAKAGVPINAMAAIAVANFFMAVPRSSDIAIRKWQSVSARGVFRRFPARVALW